MYARYCELRDSRHFKDSDIAKQAGITPSTFSDWKKGKSAPNVLKMVAIARVLGTSVEYIVTGDASTSPAPRENNTSPALTPEEMELVAGFRVASRDRRDDMLNMARAALNAKSGAPKKESRGKSLYSADEEVVA